MLRLVSWNCTGSLVVCCLVLCLLCHHTADAQADESCTDETALLQNGLLLSKAKKATPLSRRNQTDIQSPKVMEMFASQFGKTDFGTGESMGDILKEAHVTIGEVLKLVKEFMLGRMNTTAFTSALFAPAIEFKILDRDGNGVLNEQDITIVRSIVKRIPIPAYGQLMEKVFDQTRTLFQMCDANKDGNTTKAEWIEANKHGVEITPETESKGVGGSGASLADVYHDWDSEKGGGVYGGFKALAKSFGFLNQDFLHIFKTAAQAKGPASSTAAAAAAIAAAFLHHEEHGHKTPVSTSRGDTDEPTSLLGKGTMSSKDTEDDEEELQEESEEQQHTTSMSEAEEAEEWTGGGRGGGGLRRAPTQKLEAVRSEAASRQEDLD